MQHLKTINTAETTLIDRVGFGMMSDSRAAVFAMNDVMITFKEEVRLNGRIQTIQLPQLMEVCHGLLVQVGSLALVVSPAALFLY